jgi:hypothetical protein
MTIKELPYQNMDTSGFPYTEVKAGDWILTIVRLPTMTEIRTDDGFSVLDSVFLEGHPPEDEIAEWWINDWEKRDALWEEIGC